MSTPLCATGVISLITRPIPEHFCSEMKRRCVRCPAVYFVRILVLITAVNYEQINDNDDNDDNDCDDVVALAGVLRFGLQGYKNRPTPSASWPDVGMW